MHISFQAPLWKYFNCVLKFTYLSTWKHTKASISIHIWIEKEPHSAIFERPVKNEHWVLSFWCFVPTPPNADAQIQLSSHCRGFVADSALLSSVFKKSSTVIHNLLSPWYKDHWNRKLTKSQQIDYHARVRSKFEHNMFGVLHALQIKLCQYKRQQGAECRCCKCNDLQGIPRNQTNEENKWYLNEFIIRFSFLQTEICSLPFIFAKVNSDYLEIMNHVLRTEKLPTNAICWELTVVVWFQLSPISAFFGFRLQGGRYMRLTSSKSCNMSTKVYPVSSKRFEISPTVAFFHHCHR